MNTHTEYSDKTPLHQAAIRGCAEEVEKLISSGAMPDAQTRRGRTALHYAAENGHQLILELLMTSGAQINLPNKWGRRALHYAASKHRVGCVQTLLSNGADPNIQDVDGQTPLYHAVAASTWQALEQVKIPDTEGHNAELRDTLVCGTILRDTEMCDTILLLLSHGANSDTPDKSGITPLHVAAEIGNTEICKHLLEEGKAQINALDQHGATPLHYAAYQGHRHVTELLLSHGACSTVQDNAGLLAKMYAVKRSKVQMKTTHVDELQEHRNGDFEITPSSTGALKSGGKTKEQIQQALNEKTKLPFLTNEVDFSSCLLQVNATEGLGRVQRTEEVERIEQDISRFIEATLRDMVLAEPRFSYALMKAGSTAEDTKVGVPDEIDYMCCLTDLSNVSFPYTSSNDPPGYLRIKIHDQGLETWRDFVDNDGFLEAEKLHQHFHFIFDWFSENSDLTAMSTCLHKMRDYRGDSDLGVTVDMSQTKPGSRLYFLWRGCQFKRIIITVDLIPAIEIPGWPHNAIVPPQEGCNRYHVIPKVSPEIQNNPSAGLFWRISTSLAEKCLFSAMEAPVHACYTICKSLVHFPDPGRLFPDYLYSACKERQQLLFILSSLRSYHEFINSYLLKMILFRLRSKRRETSDWVWSNVGHRVSEMLSRLLEELKEGYVPSFFLLNYNVLTMEKEKVTT